MSSAQTPHKEVPKSSESSEIDATGPLTDSEEEAMKKAYRRRPAASRLERLLTRLLLNRSRPGPTDPRVDLAHTVDVDLRQA